MLICVRLSGTGMPGAPLDAPLPTKTLVAVDYIGRRAICEVPESDLPSAVTTLDGSHYTTYANGMTALSTCPTAALLAWYAWLDSRYPSHAGVFRPELP